MRTSNSVRKTYTQAMRITKQILKTQAELAEWDVRKERDLAALEKAIGKPSGMH